MMDGRIWTAWNMVIVVGTVAVVLLLGKMAHKKMTAKKEEETR